MNLVSIDHLFDQPRDRQTLPDAGTFQTEMRLLERSFAIMCASGDAALALERLLELACQFLEWPAGHVYRVNANGGLESSGAFYLTESTGLSGLRSTWRRAPTPCTTLPTSAMERRETVLACDVRSDAALLDPSLDACLDIRAAVAFPLRSGDDLVGVLELLGDRPEIPSSRQLELLGHVSGAMGVVLARAASSRDRVEAEVRSRTADLQASRDTAEGVARAKAALLATMTHELRTPLSGVYGMTSLLLEDELTETQRDHACHILSSTEALLSLIDDVLDYSRVESGHLQIEDVDYDAVALVDDVLALLGPRAADKRIELAAVIDPGVPKTVGGDPGRVRQILINLVGNALKFTQKGHVAIRIEPAFNDQGTLTALRFDVEDTGIGMAADVLPHLFQPFVQADASMHRLFGGSGLGLSICRRLSEALGGSIGVDSSPGAGSTFWFTVAVARHAGRFLEPTNLLAGTRILLMTRSTLVAQEMSRLLQSAGATVEQAQSSDQAVRLVRTNAQPFDAAIVDLQQREARATAGGASFHALLGDRCRVIALANPWNKPNDGSASEVDGVVTTPIRHSQLLTAVARLLGRSCQAPARRAAERFDGDLVGLRILLVDDDAANRKVGSTFLTKFGCTWTVASNGREAVDAVTRDSFDLVLMDCQMPDMDGFEATRAIRELPAYRSLPIVAMTANIEPGIADRCLAAGMNDYLVKPVRPRLLADSLLRWTGSASSAETAVTDRSTS